MRKKKGILLKKIKRKKKILLKIKLSVRRNLNAINLHKRILKVTLKENRIRILFPISIKRIKKSTNL